MLFHLFFSFHVCVFFSAILLNGHSTKTVHTHIPSKVCWSVYIIFKSTFSGQSVGHCIGSSIIIVSHQVTCFDGFLPFYFTFFHPFHFPKRRFLISSLAKHSLHSFSKHLIITSYLLQSWEVRYLVRPYNF